MLNIFFSTFKKYKFVVFTISSNVVFLSLLNLITNRYCEFNFLINLNNIENFSKYYFYQGNIFELKNILFCLGSVDESIVIYSGIGYILFSQIFFLFMFVILLKINLIALKYKIFILISYALNVEYLFNYKANLNMINYVLISQLILFLGILLADDK